MRGMNNEERPTPIAEAALHSVFERLHRASRREPAPGERLRADRLRRLLDALLEQQEAFAQAVDEDFGGRSRHETLLAEVFTAAEAIRHALANLHGWMKPRRRPVRWMFRPGKGEVRPQPLGVVGIISPWNYPLQLSLSPMAGALAAGNRVMLKPSELTPATGALLARTLARAFSPEEVAVVEGDAVLAAAFSRLPFDHLLFTGSTRVGRLVMSAAAANLTPVTLELGGKSPVILAPSADTELAMKRVMAGKLLNAGQTCVAPDYVLAPAGWEREVVGAASRAVRRLYPTLVENPDYSSIVSAAHAKRLRHLLADARERGAQLVELNPAGERFNPAGRRLPPTLLLGVNDEMAVMQEEVFGPVLPVIPYRGLDEAIRYVSARPRPLALYVFARSRSETRAVLDSTVSGGACVNDVLLHVAQESLPFGGVGASGMGRYHGREGFETFSNLRAVFRQRRWTPTGMLHPPYGSFAERMLRSLLRPR